MAGSNTAVANTIHQVQQFFLMLDACTIDGLRSCDVIIVDATGQEEEINFAKVLSQDSYCQLIVGPGHS